MNRSKTRFFIGGMTCVNCQNKIETALLHMAGIETARVSYQNGTADLVYDPDWITLEEIQQVIRDAGYEVLSEKARNKQKPGRAAHILIVIAVLYALLENSGILNRLAPSQLADTRMGYGMLFVIGLLTSVHCIAMCGGINLSQCIPQKRTETGNGASVLGPALFYNLGRVISYTVIGAILGLAGMLIGGGSGAGLSLFLQGILKIIAGIFMVLMGINMLGIFPGLRRFTPQIPRFLAGRVNQKKASSRQPFVVGMLNGLMPCGPLQSMQIVALASGNPLAGAFSMFMFSLGTVPLMLGLGSFISLLGKRFTKRVMEIGAVLVMVLGLAMLSQGFSLSGLLDGTAWEQTREPLRSAGSNRVSEPLSESTAASEPEALSESEAASGEKTDVQIVRSTLSGGRYPNITVKAGVPVRWIIDVPKGALNGCNYRMVLRAYGISHTFSEGENVIEFTPEETGTVTYTCWMGMIRGKIFVTDESGTSEGVPAENGETNDDEIEDLETGDFGMGCCGGY